MTAVVGRVGKLMATWHFDWIIYGGLVVRPGTCRAMLVTGFDYDERCGDPANDANYGGSDATTANPSR